MKETNKTPGFYSMFSEVLRKTLNQQRKETNKTMFLFFINNFKTLKQRQQHVLNDIKTIKNIRGNIKSNIKTNIKHTNIKNKKNMKNKN